MGTAEEILTELLGVEMELQDVQGIFLFVFILFLAVFLLIPRIHAFGLVRLAFYLCLSLIFCCASLKVCFKSSS